MTQLQEHYSLQNGKYIVVRCLGQGGFGITYLAEQTNLGRKVAIKEFFLKEHCNRDNETSHVTIPSEGSREMVNRFKEKFLKEARTIAGLAHPNIVKIYDVFEENETAYFVMDYIDNGDLKTISEGTPLPEDIAVKYIIPISDALEYLHGNNILHLDIKPSNILISKKREAILIDFGISKRYDGEGDETSSTPVGFSKGYAPLEQYNEGVKKFSPSTDIYSLGATIYRLVTGLVPPEASLIYEDGLPSSYPNVSKEAWMCITAFMQPKRKDRPQTIQEAKKYIQKWVESQGSHSTDWSKGIKKIISSKKETVNRPADSNQQKAPTAPLGSNEMSHTSSKTWFGSISQVFQRQSKEAQTARNTRNFKFLIALFVILSILAAAIIGGVYLWKHQKQVEKEIEQEEFEKAHKYDNARIGDYFYADGTTSSEILTYKDAPIGIIFSLSASESEKAAGFTHGEIISLEDAVPYCVAWGVEDFDVYGYVNHKIVTKDDVVKAKEDSDGYKHIVDDFDTIAVSAPVYARNYKYGKNSCISSWYLPNASQWVKIIENLGGDKVSDDIFMKFDKAIVTEGLKKANINPARWYWINTEFDDNNAWSVCINQGFISSKTPKNRETGYVRPVAAF